jgi:hypothetical protein
MSAHLVRQGGNTEVSRQIAACWALNADGGREERNDENAAKP